MSLRARLLIGLSALATLGLAVMAVVTYEEQHSFLYQRVDQQLGASLPLVAGQLGVRSGGVLPTPPRRFDPRLRRRPRTFQASGTYGVLLDQSGKAVKVDAFAYGGSPGPPPAIPPKPPLSEFGSGVLHIFTVDSQAGSGLRYRAAAVAVGDGRTVAVAVPLREVDQTLHRLLEVEVLVGGGVILALLLLGWIVIRVGLRPLERIGRVAREISHGDLARRVTPATPRTEVGRLGLALNDMLMQIEQAFADREQSEARLRQFVADASHELRTPLASIRAYTEAFRLGAAADPQTLERAMSRTEGEVARMGVLVEDLLLLARLNELPATRREPIDLRELVEHAADDARAIDPERNIDLRTRWTPARARRPRPVTSGAGQPHPQCADPHAGGLADRGECVSPAGSRRARGPRPRTRPARGNRRQGVRTLLARRPRDAGGGRVAPVSVSRSSKQSSRPTTATSMRAMRPAAGPSSAWSCLPAVGPSNRLLHRDSTNSQLPAHV